MVTVHQPLQSVQRLGAGVHELHLRVRPGTQMTRVLVHAAGREIGRASFHSSMSDSDGSATWVLPFMVHTAGAVRVSLSICQSFHGTMEGTQLEVERLHVESTKRVSLARQGDPLPGLSNLDFWGWTSLAWEGHGHRFRVGESYIRQRGVIEPWKWGCNFMQTHAYAYLPWHLELVKFMHEHDFLVDEHGFPPQRRMEKVNGRVAVFRVHVQGSRLLPKSQEHLWPRRYMLEHTLAFVERWGRGFSNAMAHGWRGCIDGWEVEEYADPRDGVLASPDNVVTLVQKLWKYNPGVCLGSCNHTAGYKPAHYVWLHEGYHGPNFAHVAMDAGSSWKVSLPGYDDHVPMGEFAGARNFQNPHNDIFLGYQADSRTYSYSDIGNLTWPDWLIKQSHDYCRLRNLGDDTAPPSALFWLNEGARLLPEAIRDYAYIACQDVPRVAVAMNLKSTGLDGCFHWLADAFEDYLPQANPDESLPSSLTLRPREWDTAGTTILQNNHLRLERDAHRATGRLRLDPQGIAHFDLDSLSFPLTDVFMQPMSAEARVILQHKAASSRSHSWEHTQELEAGEYELHITLNREDQQVLELQVNGRQAGILTATRQQVCFSLPKATLCTLRLQPWEQTSHEGSDPGLEPVQISLTRCRSFDQPVVHEINTIDPTLTQPHWQVEQTQPRLPALLGQGGTQLVDVPVELQAGQYLLVIAANAASEHDDVQVRVGLNRHRHFTKHFAGLEAHKSIADAIGKRHVPAAYSRIGRLALSRETRWHVVPLNIFEPGRHVVELFNPGPAAKLQGLCIYRTPVEHELRIKGGALAEVAERHASPSDGWDVCYTMLNDLPVLRMEIVSAADPRSILLMERTRFAHVLKHAAGWTLRAEDGFTPDLHVLLSQGQLTLREEDQKVIATIPAGESVVIHLAADVGSQQGMDAASIASALRQPRVKLEITDALQPMRVKQEGQLPVQVVKIENPQNGPYFVREKGWWRLRGAQPITLRQEDDTYLRAYQAWVEHNEKIGDTREALAPFAYRRHTAELPPARPTHGDYLKVYTPGEDAWVLPHGFIRGLARPGFGCQYTLAMADVEGSSEQATLRVRVDRLTAYVFAPRVRFVKHIAAAWLNDEPWHYFDDDLVMLPQARGEYHLNIQFGQAVTPTITRTSASIVQSRLEGRQFSFTAALPEYVRKLPEGLDYHAHIRLPHASGRLACQHNAQIVRRGEEGAIIRFQPGRVTLSW